MGRRYRPLILVNYLDDHVVKFPNETAWQLRKKLAAKPWAGTRPNELKDGEEWKPFEEHAVYECVQVQGPRLGTVAIVKVRMEVPADLPPSDDPQERAKHASGMRLNLYTANEIGTLKRLTAAGCSATPTLLAVKVDMQTESDLGRPGWVTPPWMPGGYIVYILMVKIPAQPLDYTFFWRMTQNERNEVRIAFRKAFLELTKLDIFHEDPRIENLMWDKPNRKCYIIDMELAFYDPKTVAKFDWFKDDFVCFLWNLARKDEEPNW